MALTYTLIASNTLSSSAASVTFSSIPGTYTDLVLRISARSSRSAAFDTFQVTINSDAATNYSQTTLYGNSSTTLSFRYTSDTSAFVNFFNGNTATSSTFSSNEFYFPNYAVASNKPWSAFSVSENNSASADSAFVSAEAFLWRNTAAITSISLKSAYAGVNIASGSSFWLYGIKKD